MSALSLVRAQQMTSHNFERVSPALSNVLVGVPIITASHLSLAERPKPQASYVRSLLPIVALQVEHAVSVIVRLLVGVSPGRKGCLS